ncbi:MAG: hypothetical protein H7A21_12850 [Spirochaetales bacterium]|nr:hypothetical protein [Leptospiraceae bacterium]MCP5482316.1 hypothetical protein [Spirochaetales bacterium]MCP5484245.1 hypothetical protein [Spirochaetales bacterium]
MSKRETADFSISFLDLLSGALGAAVLLFLLVGRLVGLQSEYLRLAQLHRDRQLEAMSGLRAELDNMESTLEIRGPAEHLNGAITRSFAQLENIEGEMARFQDLTATSVEARVRLQNEIHIIDANIARAEQSLDALSGELVDLRYMIAVLTWEEDVQVDLMVLDPSGRKFSPVRQVFPDHPGRITRDARSGPATEIFEVVDPEGIPVEANTLVYEIFALNPTGASTAATLTIFHPDGVVERSLSLSGTTTLGSPGRPIARISIPRTTDPASILPYTVTWP